MSKMETVSPVEILRDYDREMTVKQRAMLADEIERLNEKLAVALYRAELLRDDIGNALDWVEVDSVADRILRRAIATSTVSEKV